MVDPAHFQRQLDSALRAKERNSGPASPRPNKDRDETLQVFAMNLMRQDMDAMKMQPGSSQYSIKTTITSGESPCCKKPLEELKPVTLKQMKVPLVHTGRYLVCRTITQPLTLVSTSAIIEDLEGSVEDLSVYNFRVQLNDASWLPHGTIFVIKEPYLKHISMGDATSMRVDSPSDIVFVDETDREILEKVGALKWYRPDVMTMDQLRKKGNECFIGKDHEKALKYYNRALRLQPDEAVIQLNRAAALIQLEYFHEAYHAAEVALKAGANKEKALFRKRTLFVKLTPKVRRVRSTEEACFDDVDCESGGDGTNDLDVRFPRIIIEWRLILGKASYGMRNWQASVGHFQALLKQYPQNEDSKSELTKAVERLRESQTGNYDLRRLYRDAVISEKQYLDVADYVGPVEVVYIPGKGKGIVTKEDVKKGTLLMVSKAFACSYTEDLRGSLVALNLITMKADRKTEFLNKVRVVQMLLRNPQRAKEIYDLYAGDLPRDEVIPEGIIDVARIEQICSYNRFAAETKDAQYGAAREVESFMSNAPTALFTLPSFFNHSCVANAYRVFYGDVVMLYAVSDLKKGEEVTLGYISPIKSFDERESLLSRYRIRCVCKLCVLDRSDRSLKERESLVKQCENMKPMLQMNPNGAITMLNKLVKKVRQSYENRTELQIQLFQPLHMLARAYLPVGNFRESMKSLKKILGCLSEPLYYSFAPEICSQIVLCCGSTHQLDLANEYTRKAMDAARIRAGIDSELYAEIVRDPKNMIP